MNIAIWGTIGMLAGCIVSIWIDKPQRFFITDLVFGMIGALIGGFALFSLREPLLNGSIQLFSVLGSILGSILALTLVTLSHKTRGTSKFFQDE